MNIIRQLSYLFNFLPWRQKARAKNSIREIVSQKRRIMSKEQVAEQSAAICERLEHLTEFCAAKVILLYYPLHNEVDLRSILEKYRGEKTILLPVTHRKSIEMRYYEGEESMHHGHLGIREPQTSVYNGKVDMIVVPGVAFDHKMARLGRGGGYYDRFLRHHLLTPKVGVCYDFQVRHRPIPTTHHDHHVSVIVTPTRVIRKNDKHS